MKHFKRILVIGWAFILLYPLIMVFQHPDAAYYDTDSPASASKGNASEITRSAIIQQLNAFQDGYVKRDTSSLRPFMEQLFSRDNVLVLGTQPFERRDSYERIKHFVFSDWRRFGDCRFLMNDAHISSSGNVAWVSTIGYVDLDISRFLILPLRLSGVMVKENDAWKFQYMQFQFDLDFSPLLITLILLLIWLLDATPGLLF